MEDFMRLDFIARVAVGCFALGALAGAGLLGGWLWFEERRRRRR